MNKLIIAAATVASLGLSVAANAADGRDTSERAVYSQGTAQPTLAPSYDAQSQTVYEGRNATTVAPTTGVEPYIAQQIEGNARSSR